jgi:hypothetical protein
LILPGAWLTDGFDQFQGDLPQLKEGQFGAGWRGLTLIFGLGEIAKLSYDDLGDWQAEQASPVLSGVFKVTDDDANLGDRR